MKKIITTSFTETEFRALIRDEIKSALSDGLSQVNTPNEEGFLTIAEAGNLLKLKPGSIYNLVNKQKIPFHKKQGSNRILFTKSELLEWLKEEKE